MKKHLIMAVAALFAMASYAQDTEADTSESIRFGLKGGLNLATIRGDVSDASFRAGIHFGVTAEIRLSDKFSLQPELLYSMQGVVENGQQLINGELVEGKGTTKLDYITLPVMAKIYVSKGFSVEIGPQIGLVNNAKVEYDFRYNGSHISGGADVSSQIKSLDFAMNAGLGYQLSSGLFFQGRYSLGLTNVYDGDAEVEGKNGVLQFSVGYQFK